MAKFLKAYRLLPYSCDSWKAQRIQAQSVKPWRAPARGHHNRNQRLRGKVVVRALMQGFGLWRGILHPILQPPASPAWCVQVPLVGKTHQPYSTYLNTYALAPWHPVRLTCLDVVCWGWPVVQNGPAFGLQ